MLVLPVAQLPKASGVGPTLRLRTTATVVPLSGTGALPTVTLPVIASEAVEVGLAGAAGTAGAA